MNLKFAKFFEFFNLKTSSWIYLTFKFRKLFPVLVQGSIGLQGIALNNLINSYPGQPNFRPSQIVESEAANISLHKL